MVTIFGIPFSPLTLPQLVDKLVNDACPAGEGARLIVTTNLDQVVNLTRNEGFRVAHSSAWQFTADGMPVFIYAKLRGAPLPSRVCGPELFEGLMERLSPGVHRPFFMVSSAATGEYLKAWLIGRGFSEASVGWESPPFGFEKDLDYSDWLTQRIRAHGTTHLFLGVGSPKSEVWVHREREHLGNCYALGLGAGLDFFAGVQRRAPKWMRRVGAEWLWRFAHDPRRLFRRYFIDSWRVFIAIYRDVTGQF